MVHADAAFANEKMVLWLHSLRELGWCQDVAEVDGTEGLCPGRSVRRFPHCYNYLIVLSELVPKSIV